MQTIEGAVIEKLLNVQSLIDNTPVCAKHRNDLEKASNIVDEILDILQPGGQEKQYGEPQVENCEG